MNRREFFKYGTLATGSLMIPGFLKAVESNHFINTSNNKLVIIQLSGGCDGLHAAIPFRNDIYYSARPKLAIPKQEVLTLNDGMGFNPVMTGMKSLYDEGLLTLFNNVGYPNANRSHFRSMDVWHTGSNENEYWSTGWIGRYMDHTCSQNFKAHEVLELDDTLSLALKGQQFNGLAVTDINLLNKTIQTGRIKSLNEINPVYIDNDNLSYLYKTLSATTSSVDYLQEKNKIYRSKETYPSGAFGKNLRSIGELINSGSDTSIYYASLTGFDTHAGQKGKFDRLIKQVSDGVTTLVSDLKTNNHLDQCTIMIFSEFGRRVKENASGGTDHGAGNNLYLISNQMKNPGIYNGPTDLSNLDNGDVRYSMDFREIYATVLNKWLHTDDTKILKRTYKQLDIFKG